MVLAGIQRWSTLDSGVQARNDSVGASWYFVPSERHRPRMSFPHGVSGNPALVDPGFRVKPGMTVLAELVFRSAERIAPECHSRMVLAGIQRGSTLDSAPGAPEPGMTVRRNWLSVHRAHRPRMSFPHGVSGNPAWVDPGFRAPRAPEPGMTSLAELVPFHRANRPRMSFPHGVSGNPALAERGFRVRPGMTVLAKLLCSARANRYPEWSPHAV